MAEATKADTAMRKGNFMLSSGYGRNGTFNAGYVKRHAIRDRFRWLYTHTGAATIRRTAGDLLPFGDETYDSRD